MGGGAIFRPFYHISLLTHVREIGYPIVMDIVTRIEKTVFAVRWMLLPLYVGLIGAEALYIMHFLHEVMDMVWSFRSNVQDQNVLMIFILELVDMTMISQLVIMTIQGGFSIFVKEFNYGIAGRPRWLSANFGSSEQKIKLGMSILGIMMVHFLRDFIKTDHPDHNGLIDRAIIMGLIMAGTLSFCVFNILMHLPMLSHAPEPHKPDSVPDSAPHHADIDEHEEHRGRRGLYDRHTYMNGGRHG